MKPVNTVKVTFPSKSANEAFARSVAASFAAQADPAADEIAELKTAVSEAVTNCIVHAYKDCIGKITMTVSLYEDDTIAVTVADTGVGIPDIKKGDGATLHNRRRRACGAWLCRHGKLCRQGACALKARPRHKRHADETTGQKMSLLYTYIKEVAS